MLSQEVRSHCRTSLPLNSGERWHLNGLDQVARLKHRFLSHVRQHFHRRKKLVSFDDLQCQLGITYKTISVLQYPLFDYDTLAVSTLMPFRWLTASSTTIL